MPNRAQEFLKTVASDVTLRQNLENAPTSEARREVINAAGFADVSKEDIAATLKAHSEAVGELNDAELEAVAGGETSEWYILSVISVRVSVAASPAISEAVSVVAAALL